VKLRWPWHGRFARGWTAKHPTPSSSGSKIHWAGGPLRALVAALGKQGLRPGPTQTNFVLVDLGRPARPVYDALLRRGVIVRPFGNLPTSLRVTFGLPEENDRFLGSLREVLA